MTSPSARYAPRDLAVDAGFVAATTAGVAFTVFMLSTSWPTGSWWLDLLVAIAVATCVLLRQILLPAAAAAGWALAATATGVAHLVELPQEPGPVVGFALAVLLGSCVRRGAAALVVASLLGSVLLVGLTWLTARPDQGGFTAVTVLLVVSLSMGAACGAVARVLDTRSGRGTPLAAGVGP